MWTWLIDKIPILNSWKLLLGGAAILVLTVTFYQWRLADSEKKVLQCQVSGYIAAQEMNTKTIKQLTAYRPSELDALSEERDSLQYENDDLANQLQETFKAVAAGKDAPAAHVLSDYFNGLRSTAANPNKNNSR